MSEIVTLTFKNNSYQFLHRTITEHKDLVHKLKVSDCVKKELLKDMSKISIALEDAKKEEADVGKNITSVNKGN